MDQVTPEPETPDYAKDRQLIIEGLVELNAKYSEILTRLTLLEHPLPPDKKD